MTDTIQGQKKILKEEMVAVIDRKLNEKIKDQLHEITELQETINRLKEGNNQVGFIQKLEHFLKLKSSLPYQQIKNYAN